VSWWFLAVLLVWAAIVVLRRRREEVRGSVQAPRSARGLRGPGKQADPDIDVETLEAAEREVKDLETDVRGRPLEDAVGDDWGPGTPKPPYV
jgi:hypothetical protein